MASDRQMTEAAVDLVVRPLDPDDVDRVAGWLADVSNYRWLEFGEGRQVLDATMLRIMRARPGHVLRVFAGGEDGEPLGLVALSDLSEEFRKATLWYVLGETPRGGRGYTSRAVGRVLDEAFGPLALHSVNAWAVSSNRASIRVLEKNRFTCIGRQRECHPIDGRFDDRLLFDLLAHEHRNPQRADSGQTEI